MGDIPQCKEGLEIVLKGAVTPFTKHPHRFRTRDSPKLNREELNLIYFFSDGKITNLSNENIVLVAANFRKW